MKKIIVLLAALVYSLALISQNTAITDDDDYTAEPSAILDVKSTDKGFLVPRLTTEQRTAITSPATGLLVYDTGLSCFYFYDGTEWTNFTSGNPGNLWSLNGTDVYLTNTSYNLGIGTTTPCVKLEVVGSVFSSSGSPTPASGTGLEVLYHTGLDAGILQSYDYGTTTTKPLRIIANPILLLDGNVGIGTTNPEAPVSVLVGGSLIDGIIVQRDVALDNKMILRTATIEMQRENASNANLLFRTSNTGTWGPNGGNIIFSPNHVNVMTVKYSGNVGIGTTTPDYKLEVNGTFKAGQVDINGNQLENNEGNLYIQYDSGNNTVLNATAGRVGIRTTNPDKLLHLKASGADDGIVLERAASGNDTRIQFQNEGGVNQSAIVYVGTTDDINFEVQGTNNVLRLRNNGNVGIGKADPNTKLQIYGDSGNLLKLQTSNIMSVPGQVIGITFVQSTDTEVARIDAITESNGSIGLRFYTYEGGINERLRISSFGDVGIDVTAPKSKLQVNGGVQIADDSDAASADKAGTLRYRSDANNSYVEMCMQTGDGTYEWIVVKQNSW